MSGCAARLPNLIRGIPAVSSERLSSNLLYIRLSAFGTEILNLSCLEAKKKLTLIFQHPDFCGVEGRNDCETAHSDAGNGQPVTQLHFDCQNRLYKLGKFVFRSLRLPAEMCLVYSLGSSDAYSSIPDHIQNVNGEVIAGKHKNDENDASNDGIWGE